MSNLAKTLVFDLEASNLDANFGYCLAFGFKSPGGPTYCLDVSQYRGSKSEFFKRDFKMMRDIYDILTSADQVVSYYGKLFDWPFLQTRMALAGLPPLPPMGAAHIDLYWTVKQNFRLNSRRLDTVATWLGCPIQKTPLNGPLWVDASAGDPEALKYVVKHCEHDVEILEWVFDRLRGYIRQIPIVSDRGACHACGSTHLQFRGYSIATTSREKRRRVQCMDCGRWELRKEEKEPVIKVRVSR